MPATHNPEHDQLLQAARSHLAALADGVGPLSGLDYDEALEVLDALFPPFTTPPILRVAGYPRQVHHRVVVDAVRRLSWFGVDPVGLLRVRDLVETTWAAETDDLTASGGAS